MVILLVVVLIFEKLLTNLKPGKGSRQKLNKDLNVHELVMYAENELETHASKVSLPKLIFIHMNELNSHLIHGVQITFSFANSEWYSFPSFMCHHYVFVIQICSDSMNIKRGRKGQKLFSEHLVSKRNICKILASTLHVDVSVGKSFFNLTLFHLCQAYSYIIKHVKYALLNILLHRRYLFIPNHVPIITCILFAASYVVKMILKMSFNVCKFETGFRLKGMRAGLWNLIYI